MSRSGYSDDMDDVLAHGRWRAQVASATRGARGQKFLRELLEALDAMPDKRLITGHLQDRTGCVCALGAIGAKRGMNLPELEDEVKKESFWDDDDGGIEFNNRKLGDKLGIARQLTAEIMYENDEGTWRDETPEQRWQRMRNWVASHIRSAQNTNGDQP